MDTITWGPTMETGTGLSPIRNQAFAIVGPHRHPAVSTFGCYARALRQPATPRRGYSHLSLAFTAALVCHCMLLGSSAPPRFNDRT